MDLIIVEISQISPIDSKIFVLFNVYSRLKYEADPKVIADGH